MLDRLTRGVTAGAIALACMAPAHAQVRQMGGIGISVFEDAGFRGANATFRDDDPDLVRSRLNNRISSLQVAPGEVWEVCERANYLPPCQIFSGSEPDLTRRSWNDRISSVRRVRGGGLKPAAVRRGLILYSDESFGGEARTIAGFASSLGSFNDRAKSVRVLSGRWEVCEDSGYQKCRSIERDTPTLAGLGLSGRISSVRPFLGRGSGDNSAPGAALPRPRLVLYDRDRYRGGERTLLTRSAALGGFGNRALSARVTGTWQLCDQPSFGGRCVTLSQDVPDLSRYNMSGRVSSARPVGGE